MSEISDGGGYKEWEQLQIQSSSSTDEDFCNIFPPSSHEGLHVQIEQDPPPELNQSKQPDSRIRPKSDFARRLRLGFDMLHSKPLFLRLAYLGQFSRMAIWSFLAGAAVGLLGLIFYFRHRRRAKGSDSLLLLTRVNEEKISHLLQQVVQINEKMNQLLNQITQMNELLSARHRVLVLKSAGS